MDNFFSSDKPLGLRFSCFEEQSSKGKKIVNVGVFDYADETANDEIDHAVYELDNGQLNGLAALHKLKRILDKYPDVLDAHNLLAKFYWDQALHDEAKEIWHHAFLKASESIPKSFKGEISWYRLQNRPFLRIAHGLLLCHLHDRDGIAAKKLANKMLKWCPSDNLGIRFCIADISLMLGEYDKALKFYLKEAIERPTYWYGAALIQYREGNYVTACTYLRKGIAGNPYVAEGLLGRLELKEHLYRHHSNINGPDWAVEYLESNAVEWDEEEIDFVDFIFNSSLVLRERSNLMEMHEALTFNTKSKQRYDAGLYDDEFIDQINDELSVKLIKTYVNRNGVETWPWIRHP